MAVELVAGYPISDYTHSYAETTSYFYIHPVAITRTGYVTEISAAYRAASSAVNAWDIGVVDVTSGSNMIPRRYITVDPWNGTTTMQNRTFVAGTDFPNPGLEVNAGEYIGFECYTAGPAPLCGRNDDGASNSYYYSFFNNLFPAQIGSDRSYATSTAARLEIGFWMEEAAGGGVDKINNVGASGLAYVSGVAYSGISKIIGVDK